MNLATSSNPDWTSVWTAAGTIVLAVVTLGAVIITIVITAQDRRRADIRIREDRQHDQEREQLARAYAVDLKSKQILGERGGVLPAESTAYVHAARVTNDSDRPIWNVVCKIEADHPSFPAAPLNTKLAARVGEFVDTALGSRASAEQFIPFTNGNTFRIKVLRSGHRGAFVWPFDIEQYQNPIFSARFTDDHDTHWEIGPDLRLNRIESRDEW